MLSHNHHIKCYDHYITKLAFESNQLLFIGHNLSFWSDQWPLSNIIGIWVWPMATIKHNWHLGMTNGHYQTYLAFGYDQWPLSNILVLKSLQNGKYYLTQIHQFLQKCLEYEKLLNSFFRIQNGRCNMP